MLAFLYGIIYKISSNCIMLSAYILADLLVSSTWHQSNGSRSFPISFPIELTSISFHIFLGHPCFVYFNHLFSLSHRKPEPYQLSPQSFNVLTFVLFNCFIFYCIYLSTPPPSISLHFIRFHTLYSFFSESVNTHDSQLYMSIRNLLHIFVIVSLAVSVCWRMGCIILYMMFVLANSAYYFQFCFPVSSITDRSYFSCLLYFLALYHYFTVRHTQVHSF